MPFVVSVSKWVSDWEELFGEEDNFGGCTWLNRECETIRKLTESFRTMEGGC
jgi:hypothetical protein